MAHRLITRIVITGTQVFWRASSEAYRQAVATSAYQKATGNESGARTTASGITLDEACKILNVKPPKAGDTDLEQVAAQFKKMFDSNDPAKGGSFYLQSKILRARERIEAEIKAADLKAEEQAELRKGWKPKVYKT